MNQFEYSQMNPFERQQYDAQQYIVGLQNVFNHQNYYGNRYNSGALDINASSETVYPVKNCNSMNKKLEAAKKWLENRKKTKEIT